MRDLFIGLEGLDRNGFAKELRHLEKELSGHHVVSGARGVPEDVHSGQNGRSEVHQTGSGKRALHEENRDGDQNNGSSSGRPGETAEKAIVHFVIEPEYGTDLSYRWDGSRWMDCDGGKSWETSAGLARHIRKQENRSHEQPSCRLIVDGTPVRLKDYPRSVLIELVEGFVRSLSGVEPGQEYEIVIRCSRDTDG